MGVTEVCSEGGQGDTDTDILMILITVNTFLQVDLRCNYKLEGENMYSLKWYWDNVEFYRYSFQAIESLGSFRVFWHFRVFESDPVLHL